MPKPVGIRWAAFALSVLAVCTGCSSSADAPAAADPRPLALTTFTVLQDLAENVAGDVIRVESITRAGAEIHGYEPTPSDLTRAEGADLLLANGLGLESWFEQFTADVEAPTVVLSEGVEPIPIAVGDYEGRPNPHAWMSPVAAETYVRNLVTAFSNLVPSAAATFEANGAAYTAKLRAAADELDAAVASLPPEKRMLVSCEGAFSYLARDAGLDEGYLWAVNQEGQGTPQQAARLIDTVRERDVPAVFCESTVSDAAQQQVVTDSGTRFGGTLYVDSLSAGEPVPTYLDLLRYDIELITRGLGPA
ncbi:metal ABC transporter substrate-binding protein [Mycetocola sp. 2940]|uniref:metal ABC transporter substrate-binding protein n=1 Tax=Mycetocola sp. 2940 TaxID=3156452 RepID=UPI0033914944